MRIDKAIKWMLANPNRELTCEGGRRTVYFDGDDLHTGGDRLPVGGWTLPDGSHVSEEETQPTSVESFITEDVSDVEEVDTFWADIYVGLKDTRSGEIYSHEKAKQLCQAFCDGIGLCVSVMSCEFIYSGGREPGLRIGLINYTRFPDTPDSITSKAVSLAKRMAMALNQYRVTVETPERSLMIKNNRVERNEETE